MLRAASLALLLASLLPPSLAAQRVGAGFRGFAGVPEPSAHLRQRGFSYGQSPGHLHHHDRRGTFFAPYFFPNDEPYWSEEPRPEPVGTEPTPMVLYTPPERGKPPSDAQVIEIPGVAYQKDVKPPMPAMFVLANGERLETQRFVLTVSSLSVNIGRCERVIPLEALDLDATLAANRERGIDLRIPADRNEISLSF